MCHGAEDDKRRGAPPARRLVPGIPTKSGLMVGLGETREELRRTFSDLAEAGVERLTVGQYLRPSRRQLPVARFVPPEEFAEMRAEAEAAGLRAGGPAACDTAPIMMDGRAVFRFAVEAMPRCLQAVLDRSQKTLSDLDWVVCHQANSRIIDHCVKSLHAEPSKFYKNISRHGYTSAASIPIALHEMAESDLLRPGQTLACIGFGGGLTWGGMLLTYEGRK